MLHTRPHYRSVSAAAPITDAIRSQNLLDDSSLWQWLPWRAQARKVLVQKLEYPQDNDPVIGEMSSEQLAEETANSHNVVLARTQEEGWCRR